MKKIFYMISIIAGLYSCQQELLEDIPQPETTGAEDKIPVSFSLSFPELIAYDNELVPMSRAEADMVKTVIDNSYTAVILKEIDNQWFVDTVIIDKKIAPDSELKELPLKDTTYYDPIRIDLRPGNYKMGLFLNTDIADLNKELKKGFLVSSTLEINPGKDLPPAFFVPITGPFKSFPDPPENTYRIMKEIFAGQTSFTVHKDKELLSTKGTNVPVEIPMERKVSRYRFLLKASSNSSFTTSAYWLQTKFTATDKENPFCDGLDVLGGTYYSDTPRTEIFLYNSSYSNIHSSAYDPNGYLLAEPVGSTNFGPYILMDKPIDFIITIPEMMGKSDEPTPFCNDVIPGSLKPNSMFTTVFVGGEELDDYTFQVSYEFVPDANSIFPPYYEWNLGK